MKRVLVTGGCGFIGSNFIRLIHEERPDWQIINADVLTYAANPYNLSDLQDSDRYHFEQVDIADGAAVKALFETHQPDWVFHFAAESHVDRSIHGPEAFIRTNVMGTFALLEAARHTWGDFQDKLFLHVSTDEVYGSLGDTGLFTEETSYDPSSPYSASKASSDHLVRAYHRTYGLPMKLTNCSNNYGPYQFPEKLIPLFLLNALHGRDLPIFGDGMNVRDWLHVEDHCRGIELVLENGKPGEVYNIGGGEELPNMAVIDAICAAVDRAFSDVDGLAERYPDASAAQGKPTSSLKTFVTDRAGHDRRYAIDCRKIERELGYRPHNRFAEGFAATLTWYLANEDWWQALLKR